MGYPWQYNQAPLRKLLWTVQFAVTMALNKLVPALIAPPIFMMVQDPNLSYSHILHRAQGTGWWLAALAGAVVAALLATVVLRGFGAA